MGGDSLSDALAAAAGKTLSQSFVRRVAGIKKVVDLQRDDEQQSSLA
jgi:hypothetical protein